MFENKGSGFFYNIRKSVFENSDGLYGKFEDASSIAKAVTIGDRTELDSYTYSIYKTAGLSHVLAISGLHISLISMSLFALLNALSLGRKTSGIVDNINKNGGRG